MENNEMSVVEALNHVQSWLNAGEYDKVIQGCQEILQIEPGNARALSLMRQAEERRHATVMNEPMPEPQPEPAPAPMPASEPEKDPLASLEVENEMYPTPEQKAVPEVTLPEMDDGEEEAFEKKKLFMAMLIPAVLVVVIGGSIIWWLANRDREDTIDDAIDSGKPKPEQDLSYLDENQERVDDITQMLTVIEHYKSVNGAYPSVSQIESALAESEDLEEIPSDPRQGEIDKSGQPFGYVYAVYDGVAGENTVYILSALFEDVSGFGTAWAQGAPIKNYPDYRDFEEENITFIGGDEDEVLDLLDDLKVDTKKDNEKGDEPKVNPDNE